MGCTCEMLVCCAWDADVMGDEGGGETDVPSVDKGAAGGWLPAAMFGAFHASDPAGPPGSDTHVPRLGTGMCMPAACSDPPAVPLEISAAIAAPPFPTAGSSAAPEGAAPAGLLTEGAGEPACMEVDEETGAGEFEPEGDWALDAAWELPGSG